MTDTTRLGLTLIDAAQAQKHVTHNGALLRLDALVHLGVISRLAAPPATVAADARYLVTSGASGAFAGHADQIAVMQDGAWTFFAPKAGWRVHVQAESILLVHDGATWRDLGSSIKALDQLTHLGVGTSADATNPFAVKANNALFAALTAGEGGAGDLRVKLNKEAAGNTLSQIFQTNWSGRAEAGLLGSDRFQVKVSPDGSSWRLGLDLDPSTGALGVGTNFQANWYGMATRLLVHSDQNADTCIGIGNSVSGASASVALRMIGGTGNSYVSHVLRDGAGSPMHTIEVGAGVTTSSWWMGGNLAWQATSAGLCGFGVTPAAGATSRVQTNGDVSIGGANASLGLNAYSSAGYKAQQTGFGQWFRNNGDGSLSLLMSQASAAAGTAFTSFNAIMTWNAATARIGASAVVHPVTDNAFSLGLSSNRWSTVYAATGTINTSDAREKMDVASLPDVLPLIRQLRPVSYRWRVGGVSLVPKTITETVEEQAHEEVEVMRERIDIVDGRAVARTQSEIEKRPLFDEIPVFDETGAPVMTDAPKLDANGAPMRDPETGAIIMQQRPKTLQVPRMVRVTRTREEPEAVERPGQRVHLGLIAQEVKQVADGLGIDFAAYVYDAESDRHGLRYDQMIAPLIKAVQEVDAKLDALAARLSALDGKRA